MDEKQTQLLSKKAKSAPVLPGVYEMKNAQGEVIYVGKAKNLKNRLSSYFPPSKDATPKTIQLCQKIVDFEYVITDNETEALILEANLIREKKPKYNIDLKENHRYAYAAITAEEFPRLLTIRKNSKNQFKTNAAIAQAFGPFTEGSARLSVIKTFRKAFGIRTCNIIPKKVCLKYHLKQCAGPCENKISKQEYLQNISLAKKALQGHTQEIEQQLQKQMALASEKLEYEQAQKIKERLDAVRALSVRQKMELQGETGDEDFIAIATNQQSPANPPTSANTATPSNIPNAKTSATVFKSHQGVIRQRQQYFFETTQNPQGALSEFLAQYYFFDSVPQTLWVETIPKDAAAIEQYILKTRGVKIEIKTPKADKQKLLSLVKKNAQMCLQQGEDLGLVELQKILRLEKIPRTIDCFDASTLFGTNSVGSMVRFENGAFDKSNYRRFKIKYVDGQNDFEMIREIVYRKYSRALAEKDALPDVIMVDGGKPQVSAAKQALDELGLSLHPLIGLAKEFEEIHFPHRALPLQLDRKNAGLKLLMRIRDEAHRFAVTYHKKMRAKSAKMG